MTLQPVTPVTRETLKAGATQFVDAVMKIMGTDAPGTRQ